MKNIFIIGLTALTLAFSLQPSALGALPTFKTLTATSGTIAAPATVTFPADPNSQIRVILASYTTRTNNSTLSFQSGEAAFYQTITNATASSITNFIDHTNGLLATRTMILTHSGTLYTNQLASYGNYSGTNSVTGGVTNACFIVLGTGGWGVASSVGDDIQQMSTATTIPAPATSNGTDLNGLATGDALYVGNYGRHVMVTLTPCLTQNALNSVSVHYDSQSQ